MEQTPETPAREIQIRLTGWSRRQLMTGLAGLLASVALAAVAIIYIRQYTAWVGLPRDSYQGLAFPVFFPRHPPAGFAFVADSVSAKPGVLAYSYKYRGDKPVYVSIQPTDPQLDVNSFNPTRTITTAIGAGYLADFDTRTTVAITAGKSLVLINSPDQIPDQLVEQFADSLTPVK